MAIRVEPATVHFSGGPFDGLGESDGDEDVLANATARLVSISTDGGERLPWSVKCVAEAGIPSIDPGTYVQLPSHRYRAQRSEHINGRLHIYCEYLGT